MAGVGVEWQYLGLWLDTPMAVLFPPELEKQMKIENLFVTWQQRSAQSNMPISVSAAWAGGQQSGLLYSTLETPASPGQREALELRGCMAGMVFGSEAVLSA